MSGEHGSVYRPTRYIKYVENCVKHYTHIRNRSSQTEQHKNLQPVEKNKSPLLCVLREFKIVDEGFQNVFEGKTLNSQKHNKSFAFPRLKAVADGKFKIIEREDLCL